MSLRHIRATLECDGCTEAMVFDLDGADSTNRHTPSLFDLAVDACRGGHVRNITGFSSVQGESEQCLCPKCTTIVDAYMDDVVKADRNANDAEIKTALDNALRAA